MAFSFFKSKVQNKQTADPLPPDVLRGERSSNPQVCIKIAEHFLRENKPDLAVDEYLNAARAFLDNRQTQLAMAVYRNIITIDPERYSVYEILADLYGKSGFHGDGASVLLALAYQYKKVGYDSEVKRVLDSVLAFAPDNPVLKHKVDEFFTDKNSLDVSAQKDAPEPEQETAAGRDDLEELSDAAPPSEVLESQPDASAQKDAPEPEQETAAGRDDLEELSDAVPLFEVLESQPDTSAQKDAPEPEQETAAGRNDLEELSDAAPPSEVLESQPDASAQKDVPEPEQETAAGRDDLEELSDAAPLPEVVAPQPDASAQENVPDATVRSFFDLQEALVTDAALGFDYDSTAEDMLDSDQPSSSFSVLNVVKNIALQDDSQDTPLFHFHLGVGYMQCGDYEKAVDELLSALYGISDKSGCYIRLAECSLHLHRRELASGFLREALACPDISSEQAVTIEKRLDEIVAG